jgi:hypothetical protein
MEFDIIYFLKSGEVPDDFDGIQYLEYVAEYGDIDLLKNLLRNYVIDDYDRDMIENVIKNAIMKEQYEIAKYLLTINDYYISFDEADQKEIILSSPIEKMIKPIKFIRDNQLNFEIDTLSYLIRNQVVELDENRILEFMDIAIFENDTELIQILCPYIPENASAEAYFNIINQAWYRKKLKVETLKVLLRCQNIYNILNFGSLFTIIQFASVVKEVELYDLIIDHPVFNQSANERRDDNLVYQYLSVALESKTPNTEMVVQLMRYENYQNIIQDTLFFIMPYLDYSIYELFVRDERNVLFNMLNVQNFTDRELFDDATYLYDSILDVKKNDSYEKIALTARVFMPRFNDFARRYFLYRLFELYTNTENMKKSVISDLILSYGRQYTTIVGGNTRYILNIVIDQFYRSFNLNQEPQRYFKIFELLNVDEIEELLNSGTVPHLVQFFQFCTPMFRPEQIAFLYSKCRGKSKNRQEFIQTLYGITGIRYRVQDTDFMNFAQNFEYEDVDQIFKNVVMGYVGLGNVQFNKNMENVQ